MLALAAAGSLLAGTRADLLPATVRLGAPIAFGAFLALFAVYRLALVRARRYPAGKGLVQIGVGAIFLMLLMPGAAREFEASGSRPLAAMLVHPDPAVRALACEVAAFRPDARRYAVALAARLEDPSPQVRLQALASLRRLAGSDVGMNGEGSVERWRRWADAQVAAGP
jgi:hypothetical protein